ncbi:MAG: DNA-formamidopyrimidine glycosylase [Gemmatimonadota bacterium]
MPELPEVETIRRELAPRLEGRRIRAVRIMKPDILIEGRRVDDFRDQLRGARVRAVRRRGKWLLFELNRGVLVTQLRMTGRFAVGPGPAPPVPEFRHVAAEFELDDGLTLFYDDVRRLGGFLLLTRDEWERREAQFGPEPLASDFRARDLGSVLRRGRLPVKNALMDQSRLAGIGNIYASESLHAAKIAPDRAAESLTDEEIRVLHRSLRRILRSAIHNSGTTVSDYRAVNGRSGSFQERLLVYGREGKECARCGSPIRRTVQSGRSSFFCAECQA